MAELRTSNLREESSIYAIGLFPLIQGMYDDNPRTIGKQYHGSATSTGANMEETQSAESGEYSIT